MLDFESLDFHNLKVTRNLNAPHRSIQEYNLRPLNNIHDIYPPIAMA